MIEEHQTINLEDYLYKRVKIVTRNGTTYCGDILPNNYCLVRPYGLMLQASMNGINFQSNGKCSIDNTDHDGDILEIEQVSNDVIEDIDVWWNQFPGAYIKELSGEETDVEDIYDYVKEIRQYIDGFAMLPVFMYMGTVVVVKSQPTVNGDFNEITEFLKELRVMNEKVFLYMIYKTSDTSNKTQYIVRYANIEKV